MSTADDVHEMFKILKEILIKTLQISEEEWNYEIEDRTRRLNRRGKNRYQALIGPLYPLQKSDLITAFNKAENHSVTLPQLLYLPPLSQGVNYIPVLSVGCWLESSPPKITLRIGMFGPYDANGNPSPGIGFRFETRHPEESHNFDHVQLTSGPFDNERHNQEYLKCPTWLPCSWPAFLLPSNNPVSLMISMLVSFYGKEILQHYSNINYQEYIKAIKHTFI